MEASDIFSEFYLSIRTTSFEVTNCPTPHSVPLDILSNRSLRLTQKLLENMNMWKSPFPEMFSSHHRRGTTLLSANLNKITPHTKAQLENLIFRLRPSFCHAMELWGQWNPPPGYQVFRKANKYFDTLLIRDDLMDFVSVTEDSFGYRITFLNDAYSIYFGYLPPKNNYFNYYFPKNINVAMGDFNNRSNKNLRMPENLKLVYAETRNGIKGGMAIFAEQPLTTVRSYPVGSDHQALFTTLPRWNTQRPMLEWDPNLLRAAYHRACETAVLDTSTCKRPKRYRDIYGILPVYTMTTLLGTKDGMKQFYKRFANPSKGILDLKNMQPQQKEFWFNLYRHQTEKRSINYNITRPHPQLIRVPNTKARDYIGTDPNMMSKFLNKLYEKNRKDLWNNLVVALYANTELAKTIAIKKKSDATLLSEARAIGIIPMGIRVADYLLDGVRTKIQAAIKKAHPTQFAFMPGYSTHTALENISKTLNLNQHK